MVLVWPCVGRAEQEPVGQAESRFGGTPGSLVRCVTGRARRWPTPDHEQLGGRDPILGYHIAADPVRAHRYRGSFEAGATVDAVARAPLEWREELGEVAVLE